MRNRCPHCHFLDGHAALCSVKRAKGEVLPFKTKAQREEEALEAARKRVIEHARNLDW